MKKYILPMAVIAAVTGFAGLPSVVAGESGRRYSQSPMAFGGKTGVTHVESRNTPTIGLFSRSTGIGSAAEDRRPAPERRYSHSPLHPLGKTGVTVTYGR